MGQIGEAEIVLEICPTSHLLTKALRDEEKLIEFAGAAVGAIGSLGAVRFPADQPREGPMAAFTFKLEHGDATPADPPMLKAAVPDWRAGDTIHLSRDRTLRVIDTRLDEGSDGDPVSVLVVDPM
jgi:hypothetical protein